MKHKTRYFLWFIALSLGLALALNMPDSSTQKVIIYPSLATFDLFTHQDEPLEAKHLDSPYRIIYFGFTSCYQICPADMAVLSAILDDLEPNVLKELLPIFLSIDPERDNADTLQTFLSAFHPDFLGLYGTQSSISSLLDTYKIYSKKVVDPDLEEYQFDHANAIFLLDNDWQLVEIFWGSNVSNRIESKLRSLLSS